MREENEMLYNITVNPMWNDVLSKTTEKLVKSVFGNDYYVDKIDIIHFHQMSIRVKDVNDKTYFFLGEIEDKKLEDGSIAAFLKLYQSQIGIDDNNILVELGERALKDWLK